MPQLRRLSPRQRDTLVAIDALIAERHGVRPTLKEIADRLGLVAAGSPPLVKRWVDELAERGFLTYTPRQARTITITDFGRAALARRSARLAAGGDDARPRQAAQAVLP